MSSRAQIIVPVVDLLRDPDGPRDRQLLFGETVQIRRTQDGWSHVQAEKDDYTGYVPDQSLGPDQQATHKINAPSTHAYTAPSLKSQDQMALSFGSKIKVTSHIGDFVETPAGYIPAVHVTPADAFSRDPMDVAILFMGTPYLWGGNSRFGLDCSGLVQAAYIACGRDCPGDSSQQMAALGTGLAIDTPPQRHDLLFFKGHVAMVFDQDTLLHANAFHMAVSFEPLRPALERIKAQGDGKVIRHVRPASI